MPQLTSLIRGLGAAGAAANARAELDRAHTDRLQAELVIRRVARDHRIEVVPRRSSAGATRTRVA